MGTASQIPAISISPGLSRVTALYLQKTRFGAIKARLLEEGASTVKKIPPREAKSLNERLWEAFNRKDTSEMVRLVKAGANPEYVSRKIDREIIACEC